MSQACRDLVFSLPFYRLKVFGEIEDCDGANRVSRKAAVEVG